MYLGLEDIKIDLGIGSGFGLMEVIGLDMKTGRLGSLTMDREELRNILESTLREQGYGMISHLQSRLVSYVSINLICAECAGNANEYN